MKLGKLPSSLISDHAWTEVESEIPLVNHFHQDLWKMYGINSDDDELPKQLQLLFDLPDVDEQSSEK